MTGRLVYAAGIPLTPHRVLLLQHVSEGKVRMEAGASWDAAAGDRGVTHSVGELENAGLVLLGDRRDGARRPLFELTDRGRRALDAANRKGGDDG